jgi:NAD(P)-dependent dehydrogenase (short-subunit alcohol dehydrogenase family)
LEPAGLVEGKFVTSPIGQTPLGRGGQPEDIGPIAVFLGSDDDGEYDECADTASSFRLGKATA